MMDTIWKRINGVSGIIKKPVFTVVGCVIDLFLISYLLNPDIYPVILTLTGLACLGCLVIRFKTKSPRFNMSRACLKGISRISNGVIFTMVFAGIILLLKFRMASYFFLALSVLILFLGFSAVGPCGKSDNMRKECRESATE